MKSNTYFFYQLSKLAGLQVGGQHRTLFRADELPLAETSAQALGQNSLLSVDEKGSVLASHERTYNYSAHGHVPALCSLLGFNGQRHEPVSRSYLLGNGYRAFSPVLLRFLAPDSWSPFGPGGLNAYGYCSGDPVNRVDPSGHINFRRTYRPSHANRTRTQRFDQQTHFRRASQRPAPEPRRFRPGQDQQDAAPAQQQPINPPAQAAGHNMFAHRETNAAPAQQQPRNPLAQAAGQNMFAHRGANAAPQAPVQQGLNDQGALDGRIFALNTQMRESHRHLRMLLNSYSFMTRDPLTLVAYRRTLAATRRRFSDSRLELLNILVTWLRRR